MLAIAAFLCVEIVGAVLLFAAVAKLRSFALFLGGLRQALPKRWARPVAYAVVAAELVLGSLSIAQVRPNRTAALAAIVFAVFTGFLVVSIRRGNAVSCNCFGFDRERPIDRRDVVRNLILFALALYGAAASSQQSSLVVVRFVQAVLNDARAHPVTAIVLGILVGREIVAFARKPLPAKTRRSGGDAEPKSRSLVGFAVPDLVLERRESGIVTTYDLVSTAQSMLFVFVGVGCGDCAEMLRSIADLTIDDRRSVTIVIGGTGTFSDDVSGFPNVVRQENGAFARFIGIPQVPSAVLLDRRGRIATEISSGAIAVAAQVRAVVAARRAEAAAPERSL